MLYEFRNPMPVETNLGYGLLVYVRDGGAFSNDVFAIVSEVDGKLRHFRSGQFRFLPNPTFDIENLDNMQEKKEI
jgi:hypothetical protein